MRWCWMTWFRKGQCSRLPPQPKKMTFDQASVCVQWEYREWKYQKMSEVGGLAYRFSGVQVSSQEQSSWGNDNREKRVCTVSVNQWATSEEKQDEEKSGPWTSHHLSRGRDGCPHGGSAQLCTPLTGREKDVVYQANTGAVSKETWGKLLKGRIVERI